MRDIVKAEVQVDNIHYSPLICQAALFIIEVYQESSMVMPSKESQSSP